MRCSSTRLPTSRPKLRRTEYFPRAAALLALLVAPIALGRPAQAQTIKLATLVPEGSLWDKALRRLGTEVGQKTQGRVSFQIYPGGVAGDENDLVRKMRIGQLHAAMLSTSGLGDIDPAFIVFQTPLLFRTDEEVNRVIHEMTPIFEKRLEEKGFVLLHWAHAGWLQVFSTKPITSFADFKALKHFVWGSDTRMGKWYQQLGLRPVPLSATDILTGLQTGLFDVLPATPLTALALQWFRSAPYMLDHRFAPLVGATVVTNSAWKKLSDADREALRVSAAATGEYLLEEVPEREKEALEEMQKRGLHVTRESDRDSAEWLDLARGFSDRYRTSVPAEIFDKVSAVLEEVRKQQ